MKLYIDMDGVLTDFETAVRKLGPKAAEGLIDESSEEQKNFMYKKIEEAEIPFWADMPWKKNSKELWKDCLKYDPVILTSPGEFRYAVRGKIIWINRELPGCQVFFSNNKSNYAEPDAILIDDMMKNTGAWKECGGRAILYKDNESAIKELKEILQEPFFKCI